MRELPSQTTKASVQRMLRNRYYIKFVTWQGVEYPGAHEPLVAIETFERVQEILTAHNISGEKQRLHNSFLKGSVWCAICGSRLCITKTTNRHGTRYEYFFCIGRNQKRTECTQKAIPIDLVERHVEEKWRHVRLDHEYADQLRQIIQSEVTRRRKSAERDKAVATRRIQVLTEQQRKLLEAHYANAIPLELLKTEQERVSEEISAAQGLLAANEMTFERIEETLRRCLDFLSDCHAAYLAASKQARRHMNQAVFERFLVGEDGSTQAEPTGVFGVLLDPNFIIDPKATAARLSPAERHRDCDWEDGTPAWLRRAAPRRSRRLETSENKKPRPVLAGLGLNESYLVPPTGFEPV